MTVEHGVVLGCPRSGTTFLMRVFDTLPETECLIGTLLSTTIPQLVHQCVTPEVYQALAVGFERSIDAYLHSGRVHARAAALQKWFNTRDGVESLTRALKGRRSIKRMIYKEPFLSFAPAFVDHALPDARVLYIYRDGRDVANSLVRSYDVLSDENLTHLLGSEMRFGRRVDHRYVPWWVEEGREDEFLASPPYVRAIWMWKYMARRCHDYYEQLGDGAGSRVLQVRYEDLMQDPLGHADTLFKHFNAKPGRAFYKRLKTAHVASIGKYKRRDPKEIEAAERVAGEELDLLGYR